MRLEILSEAKYTSGKTMERVLKFFQSARMTYGPGGEEEPAYTIKPGFVAQFDENSEYVINDIVLATTSEGKVVWVNNSETYMRDWFLENIKIYRKERVL